MLFKACDPLYNQRQNCLWRHFHLGNRAKAGTHILHTCPHQVHIIINNQETVMGFVR